LIIRLQATIDKFWCVYMPRNLRFVLPALLKPPSSAAHNRWPTAI